MPPVPVGPQRSTQRLDRAIMLGTTVIAVCLLIGATYVRVSSDVKLGGAEVRPAASSAAAAAALGMYAPDVASEVSTRGLLLARPEPQSAAAAATVAGGAVSALGATVGSEASFEAELDRRAQLEAGLSCHGRRGYDISGDAAFVWGLTFHVKDEVECCRACAAHRIHCAEPDSHGKVFWRTSLNYPKDKPQTGRCGRARTRLCNAFVYCPAERCFSYTPHNHSLHECWLKHEPNVTHPIAHGPDFPPEMRHAPRKSWPWAVSNVTWPGLPPERVQWIAGLVLPIKERVWVQPQMPSWFVNFCSGKFGPCTRTQR
jgi:hypothetical protein